MSSFYQQFSEYYDAIFPFKKVKCNFLNSQFEKLPGNKIIDIGTGTGSYALGLARAGYDVLGIDLDQEMLEQAREKSKNQDRSAQFEKCDMKNILDKFGCGSFNGIYSIGNVLVHLTDDKEVQKVLIDFNKLLIPPGILVLQIINYDRILDQGIDGLPDIENKTEGVSFLRNYEYNQTESLIKFKTKLIIDKENDISNCKGKENIEHYDQKIYANEINLNPLRSEKLKELLLKAGFKQIDFYGNFTGSSFKIEESVPLIAVARN